MKKYCIALLLLAVNSCALNETNHPKVKSISAMKNVMWKGELDAKIKFDTLLPQRGLYGLGPVEKLAGEITIIDGVAYVSSVDEGQHINVDINPNIGAPSFVYAVSKDFQYVELPKDVVNLKTLDSYLKDSHDSNTDFLFKLEGEVEFSKIHIQNLEPNAKVSSPEEAHAGQVNIKLKAINAQLIGFYSNSAHGVFTHHDTNIHTHLITKDRKYMGHCDELRFNPSLVKLYIAKNR